MVARVAVVYKCRSALTYCGLACIVTLRGGAVAQLGEHKAGSLGVRGSSPLSSTNLMDRSTRGRRSQRKTACLVVFSILIS